MFKFCFENSSNSGSAIFTVLKLCFQSINIKIKIFFFSVLCANKTKKNSSTSAFSNVQMKTEKNVRELDSKY